MSSEVDIAVLRTELKALEKRMDDAEERIEKQLFDIKGDLKTLIDAANMGKGAWWLLLKVGGTLTVLFGALAWIVDKVLSLKGVR